MTRKPIKVHESFFAVRGRGNFPVDMLRYDCCFPARGADAAAMEAAAHGEERSIVLCRRASDSGVNVERWRSFGWTVVDNGADNASDAARAAGLKP